MSINCKKCGEESGDNAKFCGNCGAPLPGKASESEEYNGPWRLTDVVREWLKLSEWEDIPQLDKVEGISRTGFLIDADGSECTCYLEAWEAHEMCKLFMYCFDNEIPADKVGECLELANEINNSRSLGYFSVATISEKQAIRFYVSIDVEDASFEPRHIQNMYQAAVVNMENWMPKFLAICNDGKSAADVLAS